jgi:trigger factor
MEFIQNKEGLVATLTVKVSQEDYATQVEKGLKKMRQTAQCKGFRPGNVPMSMIKKMYGQSILFEEINKIVREVIENYEKENEGQILAQVIPSDKHQLPELGENKDFEFVYEAGFLPEFTYQIDENTELPYYNILVEDKEIDNEIKYYHEISQNLEPTDVVENECLIKVSTILANDEKVESASILMSAVPDEYKSLFLGAKVNDVINVEIRKVFPNEVDLMGMLAINKETLDIQPETLQFTIIEISKITKITGQEFFDNIAGKDNVHNDDELREYLKKSIATYYENLSLDKLYADSIKILKEKANVTLPNDFLEKYIRFVQKDNSEISSDEQFEYLMKYFIDETAWKYIVKSLFKQADILITSEMIKEEAKTIIKQHYGNYPDSDMDQMVNYYLQNQEYTHSVIEKIKQKKLSALLKEKAKLNVIDITLDEFRKLSQPAEKENNSEENNSEENIEKENNNKEKE